jgi:hypothetical protein
MMKKYLFTISLFVIYIIYKVITIPNHKITYWLHRTLEIAKWRPANTGITVIDKL